MSPARVGVKVRVVGDPAWAPAKRAIYESALNLFWEKGYQSTSVQDIVESVGLTKGAFYHYFQSKDDLLVLTQDRYHDSEIPRFKAIAASDQPSERKLSMMIAEIVESILTYRVEVSMFFDQWRLLNEKAFSAIKRRRDDLEQPIIQIVEEAMAEGVIKSELPPRLVAFALIGMSYYTIYWWRPDHGLTEQQLGVHYAELFARLQQPAARPEEDPAGVRSPQA
jgi:AcrR family transcriptional regulator